MRSSKAKKVLKSFKELKTHLENRSVSLPNFTADDCGPAPPETTAQSERQLFRSAMADVIPLPPRNRIKKPVNTSRPRSARDNPDSEALTRLKNLIRRGEGFVISDTPEYMEGTGYRVPDIVARRLHQGNFSIQSFIDLHGLSVAAAREAFETFMSAAVNMGRRTVLVIHGRGLSSPAQPVLKTQVYNWLTCGRWRNWVMAFTSARSCDGGAGATYILLREHPLTKRKRKKSKTNLRSE